MTGTGVPVITDFGPDSGGRVKGVTIIKPVVIGNVAKYFGKKREEDGHTHQWTVYLKPYENEDYSVFIKKVQFKLHDSYANPTRILTKPPYEVTETGWGEFEINIRIYFNDPTERPVILTHILKLFQSGTDPTTTGIISKKPLVTETYDEIIFQDPTALLKSLLDDVKPGVPGVWRHETDFEAKRLQSEEQIKTAHAKIRDEIQKMKEKLELSKTTIFKFKTAIAVAKGEIPEQAPASASTADEEPDVSSIVSSVVVPASSSSPNP